MSITWESQQQQPPQTQEFSVDPIINQKVKTAAQGLQKSIQNYFLEFPTEKDKELETMAKARIQKREAEQQIKEAQARIQEAEEEQLRKLEEEEV